MTTASAPVTAPGGSPAVRDRIEELTHELPRERGADAVETAVAGLHARHRELHDQDAVGLYAGSNVLSPRVAAAHESALSTRPALGWPGEKIQPGSAPIEGLEVLATQQLQQAFRSVFAEPRFLTATLANLGAYSAFTEPGDTIAILSPEAGSHASHHDAATAGVRGIRTAHLPYDAASLDIEAAGLVDFVTATMPRLIVVGGSVILFPHDLAPLRSAADLVGAKLLFDASHVAGLIAAGVFPNPLESGADLLTFSTYKTLAGPAGGAVVTNDPAIAEQMSHSIYPVLSSNYDAGRLGPLAIALAEAVEQSPSWATETVELARELGARLAAAGFSVLGRERGCTRTHQVVIDVREFGGGMRAMRRLERLGIHVGACRLPAQSPVDSSGGIRIGTQEIVRRGAGLEHAASLAALLIRSLRDEGATRHDVRDLRAAFGSDIWGRAAS